MKRQQKKLDPIETIKRIESNKAKIKKLVDQMAEPLIRAIYMRCTNCNDDLNTAKFTKHPDNDETMRVYIIVCNKCKTELPALADYEIEDMIYALRYKKLYAPNY